MSSAAMDAIYFADATEFRQWLELNHSHAREIRIGFHHKSAKVRGITYADALDEALCFGWIDGIVHKVDAHRHTRRFTPRKPGSIWSLINVRHAERLTRLGRMHPAGAAVFAHRRADKTGVYSFEQKPQKLPEPLEALFRQNKAAWSFWSQQPPGYRRTTVWWVISAKQSATQIRRLTKLIAISAGGGRLA